MFSQSKRVIITAYQVSLFKHLQTALTVIADKKYIRMLLISFYVLVIDSTLIEREICRSSEGL